MPDATRPALATARRLSASALQGSTPPMAAATAAEMAAAPGATAGGGAVLLLWMADEGAGAGAGTGAAAGRDARWATRLRRMMAPTCSGEGGSPRPASPDELTAVAVWTELGIKSQRLWNACAVASASDRVVSRGEPAGPAARVMDERPTNAALIRPGRPASPQRNSAVGLAFAARMPMTLKVAALSHYDPVY